MIAVLGGVVLVFLLIFIGILPGLQNQKANPQNIKATLNFWGVGDPSSAYGTAIQSFNQTYKNVTINYRGFPDVQTYEAAVLNALAANEGPDIFMIPNTDLQPNLNKITPVPQTQFTSLSLQQLFPPVVAQDLVSQGQIYGLPLSIDTIAVIYNRYLFDQAGIPLPSTWQTWDDFSQNVPKLVKKDAAGNITQAAAAIGGSNASVDNASDILALLFTQNGVALDSRSGNFDITSQAAQNALRFYTQFASPNSSVYTWNDSMPNSIDAFAQGKTAMIFDYESAVPQIKTQKPFIDLETAPVPQQKNGVIAAYPKYFGYVVSKQSQNAALAWTFILNMTTNAQTAAAYTSATGKPPALNQVIYNEENNPALSAFARQALIAKSWYETDPATEAQIFSQTIQSVLSGQTSVQSALDQAGAQIYQLTQNQSS